MIEDLYIKDGDTFSRSAVKYCTKCRQIHLQYRETCWSCGPWHCSECKAEMPDHMYTVCGECRKKSDDAREAERFKKANRLEAWDSWVYIEDRYFTDVESLVEELWNNGEDIPKYCWATTPCRFVSLDQGAILQASLDEESAYEDFDDQSIEIPASMFKAIEEFNEANKGHISHQVDYGNAVLISVEFLNALKKEEE